MTAMSRQKVTIEVWWTAFFTQSMRTILRASADQLDLRYADSMIHLTQVNAFLRNALDEPEAKSMTERPVVNRTGPPDIDQKERKGDVRWIPYI